MRVAHANPVMYQPEALVIERMKDKNCECNKFFYAYNLFVNIFKPRCRGLCFIFLRVALMLAAAPAFAIEAVTLQLKWTHAFQFAGYYAAQEMGYYREAGLEVSINEAAPGQDVMQTVLDGRAEYGVGTSSLLLARSSGQPVVALAVTGN